MFLSGLSIRKIKSSLAAIDSIWKYIIKPEKPVQVGDALRLTAYINYKQILKRNRENAVNQLSIDFKKSVTVNISEKDLNSFQPLLKKAFKRIDSIENKKRLNHDYVLIWGAKLFRIEKAIEYAIKREKTILFVEDGFFRSVAGGLRKVEKKYSTSHSLVFDDLAPHYDGNSVSRLEKMISHPRGENTINHEEVQKLQKYIKDFRLSKYNDQPDYISPTIGIRNEKVLVVMQSYNDASVTIIGGDELSFKQMIEDAIKENPDADILIKVHPDTLIKKNKGYADGYLNDKRVYIIDTTISLPSLIKYVNKVYVYSSQAGFEALLWGKKVITYGKPFYAGWGLTDDRGGIRNKGKASFNKIFYEAICKYTYYFDRKTGNLIDAQQAIQEIAEEKIEYLNQEHPKTGLVIKLDGLGDWVLFNNNFKRIKDSPKYKDCQFDFLGDIGFKDFFLYTEKEFKSTYWINRRGNKVLSAIQKIKNSKLKKIFLSVYLKNILNTKITKKEYDVVIVSCWNNSLQRFINEIVSRINAKCKISRAIFQDKDLQKEQKNIYNQLIPMSGDHLTIFRDDLERHFIENLIGKQIDKKEYGFENSKSIKKIFIFCGAFHEKRRLASWKYRKLAERLYDIGYEIEIYGYTEKIAKSESIKFKIESGISKIEDIISSIKKSDIYIGNDTGFLHYAISINKPAIVISNGNSYNTFLQYPKKNRIKIIFPPSVQKIIHSKNLDEIKEITRSSNFDINEISVDLLLKEVEEILGLE